MNSYNWKYFNSEVNNVTFENNGIKQITRIIVLAIIGLIISFGAISYLFKLENSTAKESEVIMDSKVPLQTKIKIMDEQLIDITNESEVESESVDMTRYTTVSQKEGIDIVVTYLSPVLEDKDMITFEVAIDTHSVNLSKYNDISQFVELRTDSGTVISEGFVWNPENTEFHHINGTLIVKNNYQGKAIIDLDTKLFWLIFKNIDSTSEREHLYVVDKLNN